MLQVHKKLQWKQTFQRTGSTACWLEADASATKGKELGFGKTIYEAHWQIFKFSDRPHLEYKQKNIHTPPYPNTHAHSLMAPLSKLQEESVFIAAKARVNGLTEEQIVSLAFQRKEGSEVRFNAGEISQFVHFQALFLQNSSPSIIMPHKIQNPRDFFHYQITNIC